MTNLSIPVNENVLKHISFQASIQKLSVEMFLAHFLENSFKEEPLKLESPFRKLRNEALQKGLNTLSLDEINAQVNGNRGEKE